MTRTKASARSDAKTSEQKAEAKVKAFVKRNNRHAKQMPGGPGAPRKPHRFRPGTVAKREALKLARKDKPLLSNTAIGRIMKSVFAEHGFERITQVRKGVVDAIRTSAENIMGELLQSAKDMLAARGQSTLDGAIVSLAFDRWRKRHLHTFDVSSLCPMPMAVEQERRALKIKFLV